ncbi:hypothetical protein [Streptomyces sp. CRN 30]|uniref:hypothetical protein n=1 Tax=Streptomyces sp. CRN 30 TaxID=3075613 RepID=UPI002A82F0C3|nr:hypothetical protein [Streptomyces sp. CRN 30]
MRDFGRGAAGMGEAVPAPVRAFGTDAVRTEVFATDGGRVRWRRTFAAGSAVLRAVGAVPASVHLPHAAVQFVLPRWEGRTAEYPVRGTRLLLDSPEGRATVFRDLGRGLRSLHALPCDPALPRGPLGPARLAEWLRSGHGPGLSGLYRGQLRSALGKRRLSRLSQWCAALSEVNEDSVVLHGSVGMGTTVLAADHRPQLLTGEGLCLGDRWFDLGWLLGELMEVRLVLAGQGRPEVAADLGVSAWELVAGYGIPPDHRVGRVSALRMLSHGLDISSFAAHLVPQLRSHTRLLADVVDAEGTQVLP